MICGILESMILLGDAVEHLRGLPDGVADCVITDPVWPNSIPGLCSGDPAEVFAAAAAEFPRLAKRVAVHLGRDSDPRFLNGVPACLPFFGHATLRYAFPSYKGRLLYTHDCVYLFGEPPPSGVGVRLVPGEVTATVAADRCGHPCPRSRQHVEWIVKYWSREGETVLDPFLGSGTTGAVAKELGRRFIGIEVNPEYAALAQRRIADVTGSLFVEVEVDQVGSSQLALEMSFE